MIPTGVKVDLYYLFWMKVVRRQQYCCCLTALNHTRCSPGPNCHTWKKTNKRNWTSFFFFALFYNDFIRAHTILLLSPTKPTIYNTLRMSSYTTSRSVNGFCTKAALYQMVTSAHLTQHASSHHCGSEYVCRSFPLRTCRYERYRGKPLTVDCDLIDNTTSVGRACLITLNTSQSQLKSLN